MESIKAPDFDLAKTLECGQFFRYRKEGAGYVISHRDRVFSVRQEGDNLLFGGVPKDYIKDFFRLDDDYPTMMKSISKDNFMRKAIAANYGLRLIRQDPWECLISYICSANNNIPRITANVRMISKAFGEKLSDDPVDSHSFPAPGRISDEGVLRECKVGFRSRFIHEANSRVDEKALRELRLKSYEEAREELIKLKGVGDKIADCVSLFSLDKLEAFPVDVWIRRVMLEEYFKGKDEKRIKNSDIQAFAKGYFGPYCGYANQFLFHYRRTQA